MPVSGGEVLFDVPLELDEPIEKLWQEAEPFNPDPSRITTRMRLHRAHSLLLRSHAKLHYKTHYEGGATLPLPERLELAEAHFAVLQDFGLSIVSHAPSEVARGRSPGDIVAYSASRYIEGGIRLDRSQAAGEISRRKVQELVVEPQQDYYRWCRRTGAKFLLSDVQDPSQYTWHTPSGVVSLHDNDPKMALLPHPMNDEAMIARIASNFENVGQ